LIAFGAAKVGKLPTSHLNDESVSGDSVEVFTDAPSPIYTPSRIDGVPWLLSLGFDPMSPKLLTLKEFASRLGVSYSTVRLMVAKKKVRAVMPHRRAMIPESEVEKFTAPIKVVRDEA
jgi:excisionase family DNA binding protein